MEFFPPKLVFHRKVIQGKANKYINEEFHYIFFDYFYSRVSLP